METQRLNELEAQGLEMSRPARAQLFMDRYPRTHRALNALLLEMEDRRAWGAHTNVCRAQIIGWLLGHRGPDLTALFEQGPNPFCLAQTRGWQVAERELARRLLQVVRAAGLDGMAPGQSAQLISQWIPA